MDENGFLVRERAKVVSLRGKVIHKKGQLVFGKEKTLDVLKPFPL